MYGRTSLILLSVILLHSCGGDRPDPTPEDPILQLRAEGSWAAMVEVVDDSNGEPLALVSLQVLRLADFEDGSLDEPVAHGITDSSGRVSFGELPAEACLIRALSDGYRPNSLAAHPPAGDSDELVRLELRLAPLN